MKEILFCLLVAAAVAGCNKPQAEDDDSKSVLTPVPARTTPAVTKAASPAPQSTDWMWKTSKGKPVDANPLNIRDDPFEKKKK